MKTTHTLPTYTLTRGNQSDTTQAQRRAHIRLFIALAWPLPIIGASLLWAAYTIVTIYQHTPNL